MTPEMRRRQLLLTAVSVFAEKGIDGARHADIAKAASVSVPTTFAYFPTRDELVRAVLAEVRQFILEGVLNPFLHGGDTEQRLWSSGRALISLARSDPDHMKVWIMWSAYFGEPYFELSQAFERETSDLLCQMITADSRDDPPADLRERTLLIIGVSRLVAQHAIQQDSDESLESLIGNVIGTVTGTPANQR